MADTLGSSDQRAAPTVEHPRRRSLSLASRLAATVLLVGFASMVAATAVGLNAGQTLGGATVERSLDSLRASGSYDVVAQLGFYERIAEQLAASPQAGAAVSDFSAALDELSSLSEEDVRPLLDELLELYGDQYLEPLRRVGAAPAVRDVVSDNPAAVYLQASYRLADGPVLDPVLIDDAGDGSTWTAVNARVHPVYRTAVREAGLLDIYLIDTDDRVVYSATKGPDLGTSLAVGPYSGSVVGRAAASARDSDDGVLTDLGFYNAAPGVPVGAAAAAIRRAGQEVGVVVLTYDGQVFTEQLSSVVTAAGSGDGAEGLYLIGDDATTRSDPQSYLAAPDEFLDASVAAGVLPTSGRSIIEETGTTVLVQPASDATANAAEDGDTQVATRMSMTGTPVESVVGSLSIDDLEWFMVAELDVAVAESAVARFRGILVVGAAVFVVTLAFVAVAWANRVMYPVRVLSERLRRASAAPDLSAEIVPVTIPDASPVEFHRLADSFTEMETALRRQELDLRGARSQRLEVMTQMLPASLAQRIARGDVESLDEVPRASVVVVVVLGLGDLVRDDPGGQGRLLLDELTAEMDDIAAANGLDRIKVVGDCYFAACGHDRPYIDHAARSLAFAEQVAAAVRVAAESSTARLDTAIAVNTGPVTVGMSGSSRLVYDVWGSTVKVAHDLARAAGAGEVVLTEATRLRLPQDVDLSPWREGAATDDGPLWASARQPSSTASVGEEAL